MTLRMALLLIVTVAEAVNNQWRVVHERRRLVAPISEEAQNRRTLERFTKGHPDNSICWDRDGLDGFINVIDAHQHPVPFGGPEVPFSLYTDWFIQHGTVFSVFMGIGQKITKQNASAPDCCYYMHCPTYDYPVIPSVENDEINAIARLEHYYGKVDHRLHLITSATFPSLQKSEGAKDQLLALWAKYPNTFKWLGEINVFKHALAGNAFFSDFTGPRLTVARVESGELDALFSVIGPKQPNGSQMRPCLACTRSPRRPFPSSQVRSSPTASRSPRRRSTRTWGATRTTSCPARAMASPLSSVRRPMRKSVSRRATMLGGRRRSACECLPSACL